MNKTIKQLFIGIVFCFCQFISFSQTNTSRIIDSLYIELQSTQLPDTSRIITLDNLAWEFRNIDPDTSIALCNKALQLSENIKWFNLQRSIYKTMGIANWTKANYRVALDCLFKALNIAKKEYEKVSNDQNLIAVGIIYSEIGVVYKEQGNYADGLTYSFRSLNIAEKLNHKLQIAQVNQNIGNIYFEQANHFKALDHFKKSLETYIAMHDRQGEASASACIGVVYAVHEDYAKALIYFSKSLKVAEESEEMNLIIIHLRNIGEVYEKQNNYSKALEYYNKALKAAEKADRKNNKADVLYTIGNLYRITKKYDVAEEHMVQALKIAKEIDAKYLISLIQNNLSDLYSEMGQFSKALKYFKDYIATKELISSEENIKKQTRAEMNYEFDKKQAVAETQHKSELEKQAAVAESDKKKQNVIIFSIVAGLVLVTAFSGFILRSLKITRQQKQLIEIKNKETEDQKKTIEEKNKDITDSITYAKRIQSAMLPDNKEITNIFPDSFIFYKPKDIVSGDFYFFCPSPVNPHSFFIAAADCTGHGVPGAFMSLIGNEKLKEAVAQSQEPEQILNLLNKGIKTSLHQSDNRQSTRDGMDIALVRIDLGAESAIINYAGANRPLWIIRNTTETANKTIEEFKATKKAIGGLTEDEQHFSSHTVSLQKGDAFYIFTDGYTDLFGTTGKKITTKKFREILLESNARPMNEQGKHLEEFSNAWRGSTEQIDDILVIGIRL